MSFDLVSPVTKAIFRVRRRILLPLWSSLLLLIPLFWALEDATGMSPWPLLLIWGVPAFILFYPLFRYGRLSRCALTIGDHFLEIRDRKGICLKQIPVEAVTEIRRERIYGELYGDKKDECHAVYLCFFLNGNTDVPDLPYSKLFLHEDFTMVYYKEENLPPFPNRLRSKLRAGSETPYYR